jgi:putative copper export protein
LISRTTALFSVGIIIVTGTATTALLVDNMSDLTTGVFAELLAAKLVLFLFMLVLADDTHHPDRIRDRRRPSGRRLCQQLGAAGSLSSSLYSHAIGNGHQIGVGGLRVAS